MTAIVNTEACAATRYVNLGKPAAHNNVGAQTIVAYCKPTASGENGLGYLLGKATASSWLRFYVWDNGGAPKLSFGADSSGSVGNPSTATANNSVVYNVERHFAATWDGSLNTTGIHIYDDSGELSASGTNGSGSISSDSSGDLFLFNRNGTARAFVGDGYYLARWNRVLSWTELQNVFTNGPLSEPTGLILCWANQQDYSTLALTPTSRSTHVDGGMPSNTALGSTINNVAASGGSVVSGTANLSGGTSGTMAAGGTASAYGSATPAVHADMSGSGLVSTSGTAALNRTALFSPIDRGNVSIANSSVTNADTLTPTCYVVPRTMINDWMPGQQLQFTWYGGANGVSGKTPTFKVKFWYSTTHNNANNLILYATEYPFNIAGGYRPVWSYDARNWSHFDHCQYDADNINLAFWNDAAFTGDTVYYSTETPWQEGITAEWLASLPTTYITPTPSVTAYGGAPYVFGQTTSRVNELGETIAPCNLYAFKISSGTGNAPNGLPKRKFILSAGNHAGEDPGNWALKGIVEFLISSDPKAITARSWLDFYCYPMLMPAGRRGGHWRSDWEPGHESYDANRHWLDGTMQTAEAFKTAIIADTGGSVAGSMSNHSSFPYDGQTYLMPNSELSTWAGYLTPYFGSTHPATFYDIPTSFMGWSISGLGAKVAFTPEIQAEPQANLEAYGANLAKALSDAAAAGYFSAATTNIAATGTVQVTGVGTQAVAIDLGAIVVSATSATATGKVTVTIAAAGLAQAAAAAGLSTSVLLQGADAAQVAGNATLASMLNALASGSEATTGSATLSGGAPPGVLQGSGQAATGGAATLIVTVHISGAGMVATIGSAGLAGGPDADLSGSGTVTTAGTATPAIAVRISAAGFVQAMASAALSFTFDGELLAPGPLVWRAVETARYYHVREARAA